MAAPGATISAPSAAATAAGFTPYAAPASNAPAPVQASTPSLTPNVSSSASAPTIPQNMPAGFTPYVPGASVTPPAQVAPAQPVQPQQTTVPSDGVTLVKGNTVGQNIKAIPGAAYDALKSFFAGTQGLGDEAAAGIEAPLAEKNNAAQVEEQTKNLQTAIQARNALKASGKDTSNADAMIADMVGSLGKGSAPADVTPAVNDTPAQVAENAAGVGIGALGFGTYGKAATAAMEAGELATKAAPSILPAAADTVKGIADASVGTAKAAVAKAPAIAQKAFLGSGARDTLSQLANPEAKAFVPAAKGGLGKTFSSVVDMTQKAIDTFTSNSKNALQAVKQQIPTDVKVAPAKIATAVNDGILKSVQSNAAYHGINGDVATLFKTPDDLISSGLLDPNEAAKVKGMVDVIKGWSDNSARGVLNLKEQLSSFYKPGMDNANAILRNIQSNLKDVVGEVYPAIKPALKTASDNIDKADEFTRQLTGTNATTGESKLIGIARNLDNPALRGYQHSLLADLKGTTGVDVLPKLQGYADYMKLLGKGFPSKAATVAKGIVTSPAAEIAGGATLVGAAAGELKNL